MNKHYNVIIIGAGPAGTACALALRNSGLKVAIVEKDRFPRDKTCGDAIPSPTLKFLKELLPASVEEFDAFESKRRINSSIAYTTEGGSFEIHWKLKAYNSKRLSFDHFLVQLVKKYSATAIYEGIHIKEISRSDEKVHIKAKNTDFSLSCDMVLGCDGANSIVAKTLNRDKTNKLTKGVALRAYYEKVATPDHSNEFFMLKDIKGYFWIFPLQEENHYNVGIGLLKPNASKAFDLKKYFEEVIRTHPVISPKFKEATIQSKIVGFKLPFGGKKMAISGDRFLLAGDAAHLVDPLLGHGIDKAVKSGMLAATQIEQCFKQNNFSSAFNTAYDSSIYASTIGKELTKNLYLMRVLSRFPWLISLLQFFMQLNMNWFLKVYYSKKKKRG